MHCLEAVDHPELHAPHARAGARRRETDDVQPLEREFAFAAIAQPACARIEQHAFGQLVLARGAELIGVAVAARASVQIGVAELCAKAMADRVAHLDRPATL